MASPDAPVVIVGAGPSGMMAALLLRRLGVESVVVERRPTVQRAPAAHVLNARTLEICRAAGVDMRAVAAAALAPADSGWVYWVDRLGGTVLGRLPFERQGDEQLAVTPTPLRNLSQNRFEPILLAALERAGGAGPRWRHQWESAEQDGSTVRSRIRDLATDRTLELTSRYLIAADGAGSRVRKALGIEVVGPQRIQSFVMIHFRAALRPLAGDPPGVLHFVADPRNGGGALVIHDVDGEAVYMHPFDPDQEAEDTYTAARCEDLVRGACADPGLALEVATIGTWTMTAQVAARYRDGRMFIVGDAAHRFPPTGGLGLNTGVQDVHNLAWKLAAVLHGWAPASLLETFERERRPVAQRNADQSLQNALRMLEIPQALGITDASAASVERMRAVLASADGRARVSEAIAAQAVHFDMPGLQLGFAYDSGALVPEPDTPPPGDVRTFVPTGRPGARLPHAWTAEGGQRRSLLDWVPLDRFLVLAGPDGAEWIAAAGEVRGVPIDARRLRADEIPDLDSWLAVAGIGRGGALLARPDQHVAWRARDAVADPAARLHAVLDEILGRR